MSLPLRVSLLAVMLFSLTGCPRKSQEKVQPPSTGGTLDQGWEYKTKMAWWYTSQGSWIVPYDWFLALEQADNEKPFRSDQNMERLGFLTHRADAKWNPDGLPIGLVADKDAETGTLHFGVTCAACHTGRIDYGDQQFVVEGAPAHVDFAGFLFELAEALQTTSDDEEKFARFGAKVLGTESASANGGSASSHADRLKGLRKRLADRTAEFTERLRINKPLHPYGYARLDAYGNIFNESAVFSIDQPTNAIPSNAPVSFPVVWDTPQHDVVQWNGTAVNAGIGPYTRNVGEVVGVFGDLRIEEVESVGGTKKLRFRHHVKIQNLERLEAMLTTLRSPVWPAEMLPPIDHEQAQRGQRLYNSHCIGCHEILDRANPDRKIAAKLIPAADIGTDQLLGESTSGRTSKTGILEGHPMLPVTKYIPALGIVEAFGKEASTAKIVGHNVIGVLRNDLPSLTFVRGLPEYISAAKKNAYYEDCDPAVDGDKCRRPPRYKARPLNGIWASAPFLHNGSVPNLWELLQKPEQRVKQFNVGSWKFDAINVGFATETGPATSDFDTSLPGNSNLGHEKGTDLSDDEKRDLIEYIKTL